MARHEEREPFFTASSIFIQQARKFPVLFDVEQPLRPAALPANLASGIAILAKHIGLNSTDTSWLMCLASQLYPELGADLLPGLWHLKQEAFASAAVIQERPPRDPSPFSLPPPAIDNPETDYHARGGTVSRKRRAPGSPGLYAIVPSAT